MNNTEPSNLTIYGSIALVLAVFIYGGFYFFKDTIKERNWKMFIYAGAVVLGIAGLAFYIYKWF